MTLDEFWHWLNRRELKENMIVLIRTKSDSETEWHYDNELLVLDENLHYQWYYDWDEGQHNVEIVGFIPIELVDIPLLFKQGGEDMKANICGIPHEIIECQDIFDADGVHMGQIDYKKCVIRINEDMSKEAKKETLIHEMVHGMLVHLGYQEYSNDEQFVQALANAIYQGFDIKKNDNCKTIYYVDDGKGGIEKVVEE